MTSIKEIEGIEPADVERLAGAGVRTTEQLLEVADTATKRLQLADTARLDEGQVLRWAHQADLMRVDGIGDALARLLMAVGVMTVPKLAYRSAPSLFSEIDSYNTKHSVMRRLPSEQELERMIASAKQLPKLIHH